MSTNGSRSRGSAAANARRTGKPSPSTPCGAVVTPSTGRSCAANGSGSGIWGSVVMSSTVTAGMSRLQVESWMGAAARACGGGKANAGAVAGHGDLMPAEDIAVERGGPFEVPNVQDDVAQLLDLHGVEHTHDPALQAPTAGAVQVTPPAVPTAR